MIVVYDLVWLAGKLAPAVVLITPPEFRKKKTKKNRSKFYTLNMTRYFTHRLDDFPGVKVNFGQWKGRFYRAQTDEISPFGPRTVNYA